MHPIPTNPDGRAASAVVVALLAFPLASLARAGNPPAAPDRTSEQGCESSSSTGGSPETGAAGLTAERHLATASPEHYRRLAQISGEPRPGSPGADRRQFALSAMSPTYLALLDLKPTYLDIPPDALPLPEFPANSSAQTRAELDHLLELQARRTPEEVAASQELAGVFYRLSVRPDDADWPRMRRNLFHMGRQLGSWFAPESLPATADFMARVWSDASYYLWAAKLRFNRTRPYSLEPSLRNLETPNFPAYPSGHSGNSYVAAYVYQELLPEHGELFLRNADDMAFSREILGVHFASDSEAGRTFARQLVDRMLREPAFRRDLETARREIRAAHSATGGCC